LFAVLKYGVSSGRLDYVYGKPGQPGAGYDRLRDPASAQQLRGGMLVVADESNCRVLVLRPPSRRPTRVLGSPRSCVHRPPVAFGHPDAAFPTRGGGLIVTELMPAWVDLLSQSYRLIAALRVPGLSSPLDANEFAPGEIVATSHSYPGAVEELTTAGRVLWRFAPASGPGELNFPSLAQVLPDGDVLICDSGNDRIIVVNPRTREIVWQYGHTGRPGRRAGYLDAPESAVLLPAPTR
jgi:hypothetical protein